MRRTQKCEAIWRAARRTSLLGLKKRARLLLLGVPTSRGYDLDGRRTDSKSRWSVRMVGTKWFFVRESSRERCNGVKEKSRSGIVKRW